MNAKEFEKRLFEGLDKLSNDNIKKIRNEFNAEGDYGIKEDGTTYWIAPDRVSSLKIKYDFKDENSSKMSKVNLISNKVPVRIQHFEFTRDLEKPRKENNSENLEIKKINGSQLNPLAA